MQSQRFWREGIETFFSGTEADAGENFEKWH